MFEDLTLEMSVAKMFRNRQDPQDQQEESGTTPNSQLAIVNNGTTKINLNNGTRTGGDESQSHSVLSSTAAPNEPCKSAPCDFGMIGGLLCSEKASPKACNLDDNRIPHSALEELVRNDLWDDEAKSQLISPIVNANALTEGNNEVLKSSEITCTAPPVFNADEDASKVEYSMNVSDYKLDDAIGYGSSAVVHLALYIPTQAYVAVKIIDLERFERNQIDTLRREIQVMSLCRHPNLLRVLASFVHESHLWIVTPFLAAGSCLDLLRTPQFQTGILDEVAIATILQQALQGLEYLHQNGHIHRDIKAGNLLVDMDGQVQLADFGVSSSLLDNAGGRQGDVRKTFVGTPCWMAPEVMEMTKGYDAKADIWSFGITAYELATGSAPFAKLPPMKVIYMTLSNDPPKLNRYRETIKFSKAFKDLISSCLQKDPSKRPSAEALLKHPFFKQAKKKDYLVLSILASVQPIQERAKFNTSRMNQKRVSINTSSSLKHETIPEEDWNFSSEEDSENEPIDCENRARSTCDGSEPGQDRRGRFVVEPTPTATSVNPSNTVEEGQSSIQSAVEASAEVNGEIKKGRFCVNAAPTPTNSNSPNGGGSPKGILMDLNGGAIPSTSLPLEIDEEGRKSRFEILPNIPENNTTSTLAASNIRHHVSSAKNSFDHLPKDSLSTATAIEANSNDQPHIHRPFPNRKPTHSTSLADYPPFIATQPTNLVYLHPAQFDHLLYLNDVIKSQLIELKMGRMPFYTNPQHYPPYPPPPSSYYHHQNSIPLNVTNPASLDLQFSSPTQTSPLFSPNSSQFDVNYGSSVAANGRGEVENAESLEYFGGRMLYNPVDGGQRVRGQTSTRLFDSRDQLERQLALLRLENEQLKRRLS